MGHPQPAVDFLTSAADEIGVNAPEIPFGEWYLNEDIDAERGDDIRNHPGVWDTRLELPDELRTLSLDDHGAIYPVEGTVNLNALAIGLGLDDAEYQPEQFSGLVYRCEDGTAVIVYGADLCMAVGASEQACRSGIQETLENVEQMGLRDELTVDSDPMTGAVGDFIQSR